MSCCLSFCVSVDNYLSSEFVYLQLSAEYAEKAIFKKIMTKLLDGSIDDTSPDATSKSRSEAIKDILRTSHMEVDESLLKLLRSAYDGSGMNALEGISA